MLKYNLFLRYNNFERAFPSIAPVLLSELMIAINNYNFLTKQDQLKPNP